MKGIIRVVILFHCVLLQILHLGEANIIDVTVRLKQ